jgi:lysophospholipase L1-like esterase
MYRRQFLFGLGAALLVEGCGGSPTQPGVVNPPDPPPPPPPPPPTPPPTLQISRILTFGDSMTAGTTSAEISLRRIDAGLGQSYPFKLQRLLTERYTAQTISVFNAGIAGKQVAEDRERLPGVIRETSPELVILMEGANDLNSIQGPGTNAAVDTTVGNMEDMVRHSVGLGLKVMLATLPEQRPDAPKTANRDLLPRYNDGLRTMAAKKGAILIDVNVLFPVSLIGADGLHPTEAGYQKFAEIFLDAIRERYEVSPAPVLL